jgi:hypothetical protein
MTERTLEQALAHAEEVKTTTLNPTFVYDVALADLVVLANEVKRLREELADCECCEHSGTPFADFLGLTNRSR